MFYVFTFRRLAGYCSVPFSTDLIYFIINQVSKGKINMEKEIMIFLFHNVMHF